MSERESAGEYIVCERERENVGVERERKYGVYGERMWVRERA